MRFPVINSYSLLRYGLTTIAGVLIGAFVTHLLLTSPLFIADQTPIFEASTPIATSTGLILEKASPLTLSIPAINLNTSFTGELGLNQDGTVEVPDNYSEVGWYKYGPTPGELGPAVILGHVDSFKGPAVFYDLRKVDIGDQIFIDRSDGTSAIFTVTEIETAAEENFPTNRVYDSTINYAGLRLITCTGSFDRLNQRYNHNLIIYAKLTALENDF